jgi:hypothetical protein
LEHPTMPKPLETSKCRLGERARGFHTLPPFRTHCYSNIQLENIDAVGLFFMSWIVMGLCTHWTNYNMHLFLLHRTLWLSQWDLMQHE